MLYSAESPFNRRVIEGRAKFHPESEAIVSGLVDATFPSRRVFYAGVANRKTSIGDYYHPLYPVKSTDSVYKAVLNRNWGPKITEARCPAYAQPSVSGDGHLALLDGEAETDFWQAKVDHAKKTITASWGGALPLNGPGTELGPATAASFALGAGVIRISELRAGHIPHALTIAVPNAPGVVYPAVHKGWKAAQSPYPPLGAHFVLAISDAELAALDVPEWERGIYVALAHYGAFVGDQSGPKGAILGPESSAPWVARGEADPLVTFAKEQGIKPSNGIYAFRYGDAVDWSRLRVLQP